MNNLIDIGELFNWTYLTTTPGYSFKYDKEVIFILIAALLLSVTFLILSRKKITEIYINRRIFKYSGWLLLLTDLYGGFVYFSRSQFLPLFSLRIMMLLWVLILIVGILLLSIYMIFRYRVDMQEYFKEMERRKYLPKRNK